MATYPPILTDINRRPVPQVWDPVAGVWRVLAGFEHGQQGRLLDKNGNPIDENNPLEVRVRELEKLLGAMVENPEEWTVGDRIKRVETLLRSGEGKISIAGQSGGLTETPEPAAKTVTTNAMEVFAGSSRLANRAGMIVRNEGTHTIYWGNFNVTVETGYPLLPGDEQVFETFNEAVVPIFMVAETSVPVRVVEYK